VERFLLQGVPQGVVIELDQLGLALATVDDAGRLADVAETAARTRTLLGALESDEFHNVLQSGSHRDQCAPVQKAPFEGARKPQNRST
jgi:hypothetical protein